MIREACCALALIAAVPALAEDIPAKLAPPPDAKLIGAYKATGDQIYICTAQGSAIQPVFKAPEAQLMEKEKPVAKHYAGPTWEATDGSKVVGNPAESVPPPNQGDIPWLLLTAQSTGQGIFAGVRFVQRVDTQGGAAAQIACPKAGMELRVPYSAT